MDTLTESKLKESIKRHEGFNGHPYLDSEGRTTIGWGRNLNANPLTPSEGEILLLNDISNATRDLFQFLPFTKTLDQVRQAILIEMTFNLGIEKLLAFKNMLDALKVNDYKDAANEMLNSEWHKEVGGRAEDLAYNMEKGSL